MKENVNTKIIQWHVCVSNSVWLEAQAGLLIHSCKYNYLSDRIKLIFKTGITYELNSEITFARTEVDLTMMPEAAWL